MATQIINGAPATYDPKYGIWRDDETGAIVNSGNTSLLQYAADNSVIDPMNMTYDENGTPLTAYTAPPRAPNGLDYILNTNAGAAPTQGNGSPYSGLSYVPGVGWTINGQAYHQQTNDTNVAAAKNLASHNASGMRGFLNDYAVLLAAAPFAAGVAGAAAGGAGATGGGYGGASSLGGGLASQSAIDAYLAGGGAAGGTFNSAGIFDGGGGYDFDPSAVTSESLSSQGLDPITTGEAVQPWTTNPSLQALEGAASSAGMTLTDLLKKLPSNVLSQLLGSGIQGISSLLASKAQVGAGQQAQDTLMAQYQQNRADLAPYRQAGYNALDRLMGLTTPGNQFDTMQADPGYQFRLDQGTKALDNRLRAGGKFYSGSALKAGQDYAQGFASNEFGNVFNRNAALAGIGQTATNNTVSSGTTLAGLLGNNQTDMGNARASGYVGVGNAVNNGINSYNNNNFLTSLLPLLGGRSA